MDTFENAQILADTGTLHQENDLGALPVTRKN